MVDGFDGLRSSPAFRWMGRLRLRTAMLALAAGTLLGVVITLVLSLEPGWVLGFFIILGTLTAALGVRRGAVYLFFPIPALAFFVAAIVTGYVKDSSLTSSSIGVRVGFLQWVADIFFPMVLATVIVLLVGGARWVLGRQLVMGHPLSAGGPGGADGPGGHGARPVPGTPGARPVPGGPGARPAPGTSASPPGGRRPGGSNAPRDTALTDNRDPRQDQDRPTGADRGPRPGGPWPGADSPRPARPSRDGRDARDPWGDPRPPTDRPQSGSGQRPRPDRDPRDTRDQRSDRPAPPLPPNTRPQGPQGRPWDQNDRDRPSRQPRPPRDRWDQR